MSTIPESYVNDLETLISMTKEPYDPNEVNDYLSSLDYEEIKFFIITMKLGDELNDWNYYYNDSQTPPPKPTFDNQCYELETTWTNKEDDIGYLTSKAELNMFLQKGLNEFKSTK